MSKKYRAGEGDLDVKGLLSTLKKTNPGGIAELRDRGGRLGGKPMANDNKRHSPNGSRILHAIKQLH